MTVLSSHHALSSIVPSQAPPVAGVHQPGAVYECCFLCKESFIYFWGVGGRRILEFKFILENLENIDSLSKQNKNSLESYSRCQYFDVYLFNLFSFIFF